MGMIFRRQETSASLGSIVNNVWNGFIQGFTTLPVGDKPTNEIDGIFHSIGHLVGFIGGIPGVGTVGSLATKVGIKSTSMAGKALARSIPMRVADLATDKLKKTTIAKTAVKSLDDIMGPKAEFGRQALRHGTHLGLASMTSDVWEDMKGENLPGFLANSFMTGIQGGAFGATFAGIGNMPIPQALKEMNLGRVTGERALKAIAGGLVQTMPGALQGATAPENVYNALLGAYFGGKSQPWAYEKQFKKQKDFKDPTSDQEFAWYKTTNEFKNLSKVEQKAAEDVHFTFFNEREASDIGFRLRDDFNGVADSKVSEERLATVRSSHKKYGDEQVVVVSQSEKMAKIRVGEAEPVSIRKEFLRFEDEASLEPLVRKSEIDATTDTESADPSPGDAPIEIPIVRPVENFFKKILKTENLTPRRYSKNLNDLNKIIKDRIDQVKQQDKPQDERLSEKATKTPTKEAPKAGPWSLVKQEILERFKEFGVDETDLAEIRNYYRRRTESIEIPRFSYYENKQGNKTLVPEVEYDYNNNRISTLEPTKLINRIAMDNGIVKNPSEAYFVVKNSVNWPKNAGRRVQKNIGETEMGKEDYTKLVNLANKKGYYPYSGKSDSSVFIFMKKNLGEYTKEFNRIRSDFEDIDPKHWDNYKKLRKQAFEEGGIAKKQYDEMFVSNVRWWEAINGGINIKDIASGEGYLKNVMHFNKRQQPLFSDYYSLTSDTFPKNFRYITVNDMKDSKDPAVKKLLKWAQEHDDGASLIRMDLLDLMVEDMGLPQNSGFTKPFFTSNEGQLGTLIGKLAFHGASKEMSAAMEKAGIDFIVPKSVAKQYGSRKLIDYNYENGKMRFSLNGKSIDPAKAGVVYEMSPADIVVSWGVKDGSYNHMGDPVRVYKQIQEQFMNYDVQSRMVKKDINIDINKVMNDFIQEKFEGSEKLNNKLAEYIKAGKRNDSFIKQFEGSKNRGKFERIGARETIEAMKNTSEAGESFRELVRRKFQRMSEEGMEEGNIESETDWEGSFLKEKMTSARVLLEHGGTKDAVALSKDLAPLLDRSMTRYFLKRILQPQVNGAKAIMRTYSLDLAQRTSKEGNTSRLIKEKDIFFLDNNFKEKPMSVLTNKGTIKKSGTLGEQWEAYLKEPDGTVNKGKMKTRMRSIIVRTPIDNISGISDLSFAGFTGIKGGGILLHPETMKRLGGADLDIDTAMFYMDSLPKEFHSIGDAFKDDYANIMAYAKKNYTGGYDEVIQKYIVADNIQGRKSFIGMFDPYLRIRTASTIQNAGEVMRGIAVNAKTQMRMLYNVAKQAKGKGLVHITAEGDKLEFVPKKDEMDLKLHGMAAVTVTVDVANYGQLKKPEVLKRILFESGFKGLYITKKGSKRRVKQNKKGIERFFNPYSGDKGPSYKDSPIGDFSNTVNKFFGKDWSTGFAWERSEVITAAENHPKWDNSVYSVLSNAIKQLDYSDSMFERMQYNPERLAEFGSLMSKIVRNNPEITRYVKGDYRTTPFAEISTRMRILSKHYTSDRSNRFAYEAAYNLATTKGIKEMAYDVTRFKDFIGEHKLKDKKGREYNFLTKNKDYNERLLDRDKVAREIYLKNYIKQVNDFMSNDLRDLASLKTINDTGALYGIKVDSELPRFNPNKKGPQLVSLNKYMMDMASAIKKEFKKVYRESSLDKDSSPNQTALDRVSQILDGDGPQSVKSRLNWGADYINKNKRESDPEATYRGLREYFDSMLLGSINKGNKTESLYFTPQLVSKNVVTRFNENMHSIFKYREKKPTYSEIEKLFSQDDTAQILVEAARLNGEVQSIEFLKPEIPIAELSPDMLGFYKRIKNQLQSLQETTNLSPKNMQRFITSFFNVRGKMDPKSIDKYDLAGFEAFLKDLNNGGGVFSWFTRGKGSKYAKFWAEVDKKGNIKNARGFWIKMAETVAFEHMKNDITMVEKNVRGWKWVKVPDPNNPGKLKQIKEYGQYKSWVPNSHFQMLIDSSYGMSEYVSGMRNIIKDRFYETMGSRIIEGINSKSNKVDPLVDIAWREIEANGSIQKTKGGYKAFLENSIELGNTKDYIKFKKRLEEGIESYGELAQEKYRYEIDGVTKSYNAREVLDSLKQKIKKVIEDTYKDQVKLKDDFYDILQNSIKKSGGKKTVKTSMGEIDVTELSIERLVKDIIEPLTAPGAVVDKKGRHIALEEAHFASRETDIKNHSLDAGKVVKGKWKSNDIPEYDADYNRSLKDVFTFEHINDMFKDNAGKQISLFDFFNNPKGGRFKQEHAIKYLNNLLVMFNPDKLNTGWEKRWEKDYKQMSKSRKGVSINARLRNIAYEAYKKFNKNDIDIDSITKKLAIVRTYFKRTNEKSNRGYIAWKKHRDSFLGIEGEGESYSQYLHDIALAERRISMPLYIRQKRRHDPYTGFQPIGERSNYMPHSNWDMPILKREIIKYIDEVNKTTNSPEERVKETDRIMKRFHRVIEDSKKDDAGIADHARDSLLLKDLGGNRGIKHLSALGGGARPGNMLSRNLNLDGYSRHISELGNYADTIQSAIGTELASVLAKKHIRNFNKKKPMGEHTKDWEMYMRIFARDVIGAPSTLSREMLNSESLNIKSTPWWYTSDEYLYSKKSVYRLVDKLSGRSKPSEFIKELYNKRQQGKQTGQMELFTPKSEETFEDWWKKQQELFSVRYDAKGNPIEENMNFFSGKMREYSQVEGKYQLATLLARMKVMVNNVFGGGTNSWVYNGARPMRDSRKIEIWQSIDPRFKTMKDVHDWVYELGVVEEMLRYDLGYLGMKREPNWEAFSKDVAKLAVKKAKTDGNSDVYDARFRDLVKKHSIGSSAMKKAAWFMGKSELLLRTNTFMTGYLAIRDSMSPIQYELNDPYLIQQAKKAVKASQFLYSAPFRPSFARTSAGKIYSRFKLWAWNSVKFRKEIYKNAKYAGFRPGSEEAKRLERMAIADLFMIGMAKLLPYTMFDYSLPAPYSYFQDTADWMFGSDQQRERAFYGVLPKGIAPLHEFMPSFLRGPEAAFGNLWTGSWDRFADYTLVSHFPFGMLGRDIYKAIQSPAMVGEFMTGIPLHRMGRLKEDILNDKKAPAYSPGFF